MTRSRSDKCNSATSNQAKSMKRITALILAALLAAPAIAMATPATAMNTTDGTQNIIAVVPAATEVATAYQNTAPPPVPTDTAQFVVNDVFEKVLAVNPVAEAPPPSIAGDTVNNGASIGNFDANYMATPPNDVGKVAITGNIGVYGISGATNYALGGGAADYAVINIPATP